MSDLDQWQPEHVSCWARKLNLPQSTCTFLKEAGVWGAMLNLPKDKVTAILEQLRLQRQAQQHQVPAVHELYQVVAQSVLLSEEAKRVSKGEA